ncbi:hypothetical protein EIN_354230 [Entamoeba invadens IP1]|uniref:Uncharacterized protein n=1 Tax=Entamoeba invadens IP1 TaxID=370355 RepID=L7FKS8_ENTIV|nr:hypothetical protein EIN_354230 [Entamoeba invadens IP1]ELP87151.1 hypothetical protein EIN_354230 [Entamoeba invadens IP1]|eukprot:XP_004253922.1 hypothetical protein EIN_354230 [Entamoeba invadens IP1]
MINTSIVYFLFVFQISSHSAEISDYEYVLCDDYDTNSVDDLSDLFDSLDLEYLLEDDSFFKNVKEKYHKAVNLIKNKVESTVTKGANKLVDKGDTIQNKLGNVKEKLENPKKKAKKVKKYSLYGGLIPTPLSPGFLAVSSTAGVVEKAIQKTQDGADIGIKATQVGQEGSKAFLETEGTFTDKLKAGKQAAIDRYNEINEESKAQKLLEKEKKDKKRKMKSLDGKMYSKLTMLKGAKKLKKTDDNKQTSNNSKGVQETTADTDKDESSKLNNKDKKAGLKISKKIGKRTNRIANVVKSFSNDNATTIVKRGVSKIMKKAKTKVNNKINEAYRTVKGFENSVRDAKYKISKLPKKLKTKVSQLKEKKKAFKALRKRHKKEKKPLLS